MLSITFLFTASLEAKVAPRPGIPHIYSSTLEPHIRCNHGDSPGLRGGPLTRLSIILISRSESSRLESHNNEHEIPPPEIFGLDSPGRAYA